MRCSNCGTELHKKVDRCPGCGKPPQQRALKLAKRFFAITFALLIVVVVLGLMHEGEPPAKAKPAPEKTETWMEKEVPLTAYHRLEEYVRRQLKVPSSAEFPGVFDGKASHVKALAKQNYRIASWVDAQNEFGAKVRHHWVGDIRQVAKDKWQLVNLQFEN